MGFGKVSGGVGKGLGSFCEGFEKFWEELASDTVTKTNLLILLVV